MKKYDKRPGEKKTNASYEKQDKAKKTAKGGNVTKKRTAVPPKKPVEQKKKFTNAFAALNLSDSDSDWDCSSRRVMLMVI